MLWRRGRHERWCWMIPEISWWSLALISLDKTWSTGTSCMPTSPSNFSSCFFEILIFISLLWMEVDDEKAPPLIWSSSKPCFSGMRFFAAIDESHSLSSWSSAHTIDDKEEEDDSSFLSLRQLPMILLHPLFFFCWKWKIYASRCRKTDPERESGAAHSVCIYIYIGRNCRVGREEGGWEGPPWSIILEEVRLHGWLTN